METQIDIQFIEKIIRIKLLVEQKISFNRNDYENKRNKNELFFKYPTFDALLFYEVIRNLNSDMLVDDIVF